MEIVETQSNEVLTGTDESQCRSSFFHAKSSHEHHLLRHRFRIRFLLASHPQRLLWGSDWPHTELFDQMPDDAELIELTHEWLGSGSVAQQVLVTNAETLFFAR